MAQALLVVLLIGAAPQPAATTKTIEVDPHGNASVVRAAAKPAPLPVQALGANEISQAENCGLRMAARCAVARKCPGLQGRPLFIHELHVGEVNTYLPCERIAEICGALQGKAAYPRREVERCAGATAALACTSYLDEPRRQRTLPNPEHQVPACAGLLKRDAARPPWIYASPEQTVDLLEQHIGGTRGDRLRRNDPPPSMSAVQRAEEARRASAPKP